MEVHGIILIMGVWNMREQSEYELRCVCGYMIYSHEKPTVCPKCDRRLEIVWPNDNYDPSEEHGNVSGKEEMGD